MVSFTDSKNDLRSAKNNLEEGNFAKAIRDAQSSIEIAIKAFFEHFGIPYKKKHDLNDEPFEQAVCKIREKLEDNWDVKSAQKKLAKAKLLMTLTASIKEEAHYSYEFLNMDADSLFDRDLAEYIVKQARLTKFRLRSLVGNISV